MNPEAPIVDIRKTRMRALTTKKLLAWMAAFTLGSSIAGAAQTDMVAGWDFSQYAGDGTLITDSGTFAFTNVLSANYSDLADDPGPSSAPFGTLYFDGTAGSTHVPAELGANVLPTQLTSGTGSLASNLGAPAGLPFDSHAKLNSEGQDFSEFLAMTSTGDSSVVFQANLWSLLGESASSWELTLGARTFSGTSEVTVEFSTNGTTYVDVDTDDITPGVQGIMLTSVDSPFTIPLSSTVSKAAYVRLSLDAPAGGGTHQPIFDNVAINATRVGVPEVPSMTTPGMSLLAGCLMMLGVRFTATSRMQRS